MKAISVAHPDCLELDPFDAKGLSWLVSHLVVHAIMIITPSPSVNSWAYSWRMRVGYIRSNLLVRAL
jgi:hypothetical protein